MLGMYQIPDYLLLKKRLWQKYRQSYLSLKKRTPEKAKALKSVQRVHERIENKKEDFVQKVNYDLVRYYDLITFEGLLNINGLKITALKSIL